MLKTFLHWLLTFLYRIEVKGLENYHQAGDRILIVANHLSLLDPLLLGVFLPDKVTFAINTQIAKRWWVRPFTALAQVFPMDPGNPLSSKALIKYLRQNKTAVIFPEGRITMTGSLMKIYDGPGMIAEKASAAILPIRVEGAQYSPFSRLRGRVRLRLFPKITLNILPAKRLDIPKTLSSRERRKLAGRMMTDLMTEMMFETGNHDRTLISRVLDARRLHGGGHCVLEDMQRKPVSYNTLITQAFCIGDKLAGETKVDENVGILLPNAAKTVALILGLQAYGRVPAMLNFSAGARGMLLACETAAIKTVLTSRRFVELGGLEEAAQQLEKAVRLIYLEDLAQSITPIDKAMGLLRSFKTLLIYDKSPAKAHNPAVVLFTSGSEGTPKGVVLSHSNLLCNMEQLSARVDFTAQDIILNSLPLFHSFGLSIGTLLPLVYGMRTFLYPSPLHYRVVPEVAYEINATVMFGTNTFLSGYAKYAHPYDFYSLRYVFAGAEKLQEATRRTWISKFGIRILEGYGATETSPALAANTAMEYREGTVGRFLPGVQHQLEKVPGVNDGGRLHVHGPNIMLGYLLHQQPGVLVPPQSVFGEGWYDTGDIVSFDADGFISIRGRAKRFAKVGGEMVSLTSSEELAARTWPDAIHAVVALPDARKGEKLILLTDYRDADRNQLAQRAKAEGIGEINVPKNIIVTDSIPLMGSGKIDYPAVTNLIRERIRP